MTQEQDIFASLNVSKILVAILEMQNEITIPSDLFINAATIDKELQVDYDSHNQSFKFKLNISFNQINLSLTNLDSIFDGTLEYMQANNIIPMAYSPLGQYYKTDNPRLKEVVGFLSKKYNCSDDQLLISWLIKLPSGVYPVIGTTRVERINKSLGSLKIDIKTSDWFEILEASVGKRVP